MYTVFDENAVFVHYIVYNVALFALDRSNLENSSFKAARLAFGALLILIWPCVEAGAFPVRLQAPRADKLVFIASQAAVQR